MKSPSKNRVSLALLWLAGVLGVAALESGGRPWHPRSARERAPAKTSISESSRVCNPAS